MIGYLNQDCYDVSDMMISLVSTDLLIILKDQFGNVYWPEFELNSIGNMCPGSGYQIKLAAAANFSYPSVGRLSFNDIDILSQLKYPKAINTGNNMIIAIPHDIWLNQPNLGDEIIIYDQNNLLIGSALYRDEGSVITIWEAAL